MSSAPKARRGRIPLHRSVRHVRFGFARLAGWAAVALAATGAQLYFNDKLINCYAALLEWLLTRAQVPFQRGPLEHLAFIQIPTWSVTTFNPVALLPGAVAYGLTGLFLAVVAWRIPRLPLPLAAWCSLLGGMLVITTCVLTLDPIPHFTPEVFVGMWLKVTVATALIYPWFWLILVGVLPLPLARVARCGLAAWAIFALWNVFRMAFFLALAQAAGVFWLPMAYMLGGTLPDCFVFIVFFSRALEPAGREWEDLT